MTGLPARAASQCTHGDKMRWIYLDALDQRGGWCIPCDAWTACDVDPEAVAHVCPRCAER